MQRKYEMISSPSKPIALRVKVPTEDDSLLLSPNSGISKMPPPTPVSVSMATAKWLRTVIAPLPAEPSIELLNFFKSCDTDITNDVIYRAHLLLECAFSVEAAKNSVTAGANDISSLTSAWALHRRIEALKLYYRVLCEMCKAEAERLQSDNLSSLLTNERFHRCMLACCAEIVLATHKTISMAFPAVLEPMGITAFDLSKMIESFVRHEETLPRELKRHLNSIEERFLEMLAWEKGSSMYNSLIIARPYLKFHIQRLGLLGDPMPSLETLKFRFQSSKDTLRSEKTEGNASPGCPKHGYCFCCIKNVELLGLIYL
jgi:retinoblastoma-like protein 1